MKELPRSALVDLVMPDATEEERIDATRRWFSFLRTVVDIIDADDRHHRDSQNQDEDGRFET